MAEFIDKVALQNYIDEMPEISVKEIRDKAIDEFVNKLIEWKPQNEEYKSLSEVCHEIAEQMKGVRNE